MTTSCHPAPALASHVWSCRACQSGGAVDGAPLNQHRPCCSGSGQCQRCMLMWVECSARSRALFSGECYAPHNSGYCSWGTGLNCFCCAAVALGAFGINILPEFRI